MEKLMTGDALTEEQKRVRFLVRCRLMIGFWCFGSMFLIMVIMVFLGDRFPLLYLVGMCANPVLFLIQYFQSKKFYHSLSLQDIALLDNDSNAATEWEYNQLNTLIRTERIYKLRKVDAEKELLRASTEPQADTLLRAATASIDTTPQEQLLRPSQTTEE